MLPSYDQGKIDECEVPRADNKINPLQGGSYSSL
jgi:hypothetical protein